MTVFHTAVFIDENDSLPRLTPQNCKSIKYYQTILSKNKNKK